MKTTQLNVTGMTCGGCAASVGSALRSLPGVAAVNVSLAEGRVDVQFDENRVEPDQMRDAVQSAGYGVAASDQLRTAQRGGCCCS